MNDDLLHGLRALALALPEGQPLTVTLPREVVLELTGGSSPAIPAEGLLTIAQAAVRLSVTKSYLYRVAKTLPFAVKLSHRELRFDAAGLESWLKAKHAA